MKRRNFITGAVVASAALALPKVINAGLGKFTGVVRLDYRWSKDGRVVEFIDVKMRGKGSHSEVLQKVFDGVASEPWLRNATVRLDGQQIHLDHDVIIPKGVKAKITNCHLRVSRNTHLVFASSYPNPMYKNLSMSLGG
jgi:hypothetical protein